MKKIITVMAFSLVVVVSPSYVLAQGSRQAQGVQQAAQQVGTGIGTGDNAATGAGSRGIETATQSLNKVSERNNNPETGEQIRTMVQNHEKVQVRTKTALQQMDQRNEAVKFLIGPDYKNAGQVRSDVVGLRNDISKLERIKEDSLPADAGDVQGAIDDLQAEADGLDAQLTEQLTGFSLFGWLARFLSTN